MTFCVWSKDIHYTAKEVWKNPFKRVYIGIKMLEEPKGSIFITKSLT